MVQSNLIINSRNCNPAYDECLGTSIKSPVTAAAQRLQDFFCCHDTNMMLPHEIVQFLDRFAARCGVEMAVEKKEKVL